MVVSMAGRDTSSLNAFGKVSGASRRMPAVGTRDPAAPTINRYTDAARGFLRHNRRSSNAMLLLLASLQTYNIGLQKP